VTLEDILEEIVGEISDESDEEEPLYHKLDRNIYSFDGKIQLNDFCKILELEDDIFAEIRGESETLAGLILEITGAIPETGRIINWGNFVFTILSSDRRRIREIKVEIIEADDESRQE
jgi:CBS domain containing-hemolysin-like protein